MSPEFEARFLDIDAAQCISRLRDAGAVCEMSRTLMKRLIFQRPEVEQNRGWLRLRDEGTKTTLTYKQASGARSTIDSISEVEITVSDFEATKQLLVAVGFRAVRYQENYREEWRLDDVKYDFDTWPGLPTFVEIEGASEAAVKEGADVLGLDFAAASFGSVDELYQAELGRDILAEQELTFAERQS
jgi:adenylate cyclase, class 2